MRLHVIPSPFYAANGLVLVPSGAGTALVVDPSAGIQHLIREVLELRGRERRCRAADPRAPRPRVGRGRGVHVGSRRAFTVPVYLPGPDMYRMDDPASFLPMAAARLRRGVGQAHRPA